MPASDENPPVLTVVGAPEPQPTRVTTDLIDEPTLAARLGVSRSTLQSWRYAGRGPRYIKLGRMVRYRNADVDAYLVRTRADESRDRTLGDDGRNLTAAAGARLAWTHPMNEARSHASADERLTWQEIRTRFPDQWVVLVDADWVDDHNFEFGTAKLYANREHRRDATTDLGAACRQFENVGCFFTGRIRGPMPRFGIPVA